MTPRIQSSSTSPPPSAPGRSRTACGALICRSRPGGAHLPTGASSGAGDQCQPIAYGRVPALRSPAHRHRAGPLHHQPDQAARASRAGIQLHQVKPVRMHRRLHFRAVPARRIRLTCTPPFCRVADPANRTAERPLRRRHRSRRRTDRRLSLHLPGQPGLRGRTMGPSTPCHRLRHKKASRNPIDSPPIQPLPIAAARDSPAQHEGRAIGPSRSRPSVPARPTHPHSARSPTRVSCTPQRASTRAHSVRGRSRRETRRPAT